MTRATVTVLVVLTLMPLAGCLGDDGPPSDGDGQQAPVEAVGEAWDWSSLPDAPTPRTEVASVVLDEELYVIGGFEEGNQVSAAVEALDLSSGQWRSAAPLPVPLHHAPAVVHDGEIHVLGGHAGIPFVPQRVHLVYDPAQDNWSMGTPLPADRGAHGAAVVEDQAYLVGGVDHQGLVATVDVYDFGDETWSQGPDLPTPREHLAVTSLDGQVYAAGGREGGLDTNLAALEILTPGQGWTQGPDMPTPRGGIGGAPVAGLVAVAGGEANDGTFDEVEAYDPDTGAWVTLPPMPTARHGLGVVGHEGQLFTAAGGPEPGLTVSGATEVLSTEQP